MKKPDGPKPAKARVPPGRKVQTAAPPLAPQPKDSAFAITNGEKDDVPSPRILPLPNGAFAGFMANAAATSTDDGSGRFCTEGPRPEFGSPMDEKNAGDIAPVPLRQFASRLQSSIASAAMLLLDRLQTLKGCQVESFSAAQLDLLLQICHGVQAASYYLLKWSASLQRALLPVKPSLASSRDEAMASMNMALPKIIVASSELQSGLKDLVPKVKLPQKSGPMTDEEIDFQLEAEAKAQAEAEEKGLEELRKHGLSLETLYSVVPHLEQAIYQTSCLKNSVKSVPPSGGYAVLEHSAPAFETSTPVLLVEQGYTTTSSELLTANS
mmetsp:Transcript_97676/g.174003  ORF Transcript_97676/g.174003 Transcript_97676/m.174003 type:complete len:325 (-) Transcript_97676:195-1169(-)